MAVTMILVILLATQMPVPMSATSFKMDFLSSGTVRTDPLMFSTTGECLSDHVHRFYGATSDRTMRPGVSYEDLRSATGNTGNVEENKSLYWNPAIYKVNNQMTNKMYELVDVWFASAYYVFQTGSTKAFPNGFKMKASGGEKNARVKVVCDGASACERTDPGGCDGYGPSNQTQHGFLPLKACYELEINIKFPTCWDGNNLESVDGKKHVVYSEECDGDLHNECFDFDCPASHPVKIPEVHLYIRVLEYKGGPHVFSDGTDVFHSDYFSGWEEKELQDVLDNCENDSDAANPNAFCSGFLTFRGKPKQEGVQVDDFDIRSDLEKIQPEAIDTQATISPEEVTNIPDLPEGSCTGTLLPASTAPTAPTAPTSPTASISPTAPTTSVSGITTCAAKGKTRKLVKVGNGEIYTFNTNTATNYRGNVKCTVSYRKMKSCQRMRISCDQFSLGAGDMLKVSAGKKRQTFRGRTGPVLETGVNTMRLFFKSNKQKHGTGASCSVACVT